MTSRLSYAVFLSSIMLLVGLGCSKKDDTNGPLVVENPDIVIDENSSDETAAVFFDADNFDGTELVAKEVFVSEWPAWLVVYENVNGQPGRIINYTQIEEDEAFNVPIQLPEKNSGDRVSVMVHKDDGEIGSFDFPEGDAPFQNMDPVSFGLSEVQ